MLSHTLHIVLATLSQDLRTHSLRLLILCLGLAVGAIAAVLMVADRFEASFKSESAALLGADWVLNSDSAPKPQLLLDAQAAGLKATQTVVFGSMGQIKMLPDSSVNTSDAQKLVSVKAVGLAYPLRGALTLFKVGCQSDQCTEKTSAVPERGTVWMDADVWATANGAMTVQAGQTMTLGTREFKIARFIALEPDRGVQFASFAPRVMINAADLPETGLLTLGARATYRVLVSGTPEQIKQWDATQKSQLQRGQRIETLEEGRPEMRTALTRASKFLALIAVFTALIAATGVWVAAGQYATDKARWVSVLRCVGASRRDIHTRLWGSLAAAAVLALLLGLALGFAVQAALAYYLGVFAAVVLPAPSVWPALQALAVVTVLLLACLLGPMLQLLDTSPLATLRGSQVAFSASTDKTQANALQVNKARRRTWLNLLAAMSALVMIVLSVAGSLQLGSLILAGLLGLLAIMGAVSWGGLFLANRVGRTHGNWLLRSASRGLLRNPLGTLTQMTALCLALFSLLTMALIQRDALNAWQASIPPDAPNRFVFNIQPDQKDAVLQALTAQGIKADIVFPMVRARLIERNGSPIGPEQFKDDQAKRLVDREFNASFTNQLPANNVVTAGQWWGAKANIVQTEPACNNMSFEAGIVKTLGLSLGDKLVFDVGGQKVETVLSSIRTLKWESMRVNFFAIGQPCAFEALPHTYITTVRVDGQSIAGLLKDFPNLSILDTDMISKQAQTVLTQLTGAINVLFALALVAGVLVVFVTSNASRAARLQEAAVLRALGASSRQVWLSQWLEQGIIGALAGGFAGLVAWLVGQAVVTYGLEFQAMLGLWPLWTGILAGIGAVLLGSLWVLQAIRAQSPALQLRGEV